MRMTMLIILTALLVVTGLADAADRELTPIPEGQIRLPVLPPGPQPEPPPQPTPDLQPVEPPSPQEVTELKADHWFVIESDIPFFVLDSRLGVVQIGYDEGPLKLKGKFADGSGRNETRTYTSKYIATVEAQAKGQVELLVIPAGATDAGVCLRRTLTVMGESPQPPPGPEPQPDDPPHPPGPVTSFRVIFVKESGATLTPQQTAIPAAKVLRDYLTAKTTPEGGLAGWREYDPEQITANEQPTMRALWETVKPKLLPAPCLVIEVNGRATVMPFPNTVEAALAKLKEYGGA